MSTKKLNGSKLQIQSKYNRHFSESFKREKVKQLVAKQLSIQELSQLYEISRTTVYKWLYKYSPHHQRGTRQIVEMESEALKTKLLHSKVAELERIVGQKQMELDFLDKLIELASQEVGYDIKKKHGALLSNGFAAENRNTTTR